MAEERGIAFAVISIVVVIAFIGLILLFKTNAGEHAISYGQAISKPGTYTATPTPTPHVATPTPRPEAPPRKLEKPAVSEARALTNNLIRAPEKISHAALLEAAKKRKTLMLQLIEESPADALELVIPKAIRESLPPDVQENVEEEVELEGTLEVLHGDYPSSWYEHFLRVGEERIALHSDKALLDVMPVISGSTVKVKGAKLENKLIATGTTENFKVLTAAKTHASELRYLVILASFTDTQYSTPLSVVQDFFNTVNDYYRENSYGDTSFSFTFVGPVNIGISEAEVRPSEFRLDPSVLTKAAITAVDPSVDFRQFNGVLINFASAQHGGAASIGKMGVNVDGGVALGLAWIAEADLGPSAEVAFPFYGGSLPIKTASVSSPAHELGHTLGLFHSNKLNCPDLTTTGVTPDCSSQEYGDAFDIMGSGGTFNGTALLPSHMNTFLKDKLGWLKDSNIVTTDAGTYTIEPLETASTGIKLLRIPYGIGNFYYVEYRQPIGFDKGINLSHDGMNLSLGAYNGALLHLAPLYVLGTGGAVVGPSVISVLPPPGSNSNILVAGNGTVPLAVGQTYTDSLYGYAITVLEAKPEGLTVQVLHNAQDISVKGVRIAGIPGAGPSPTVRAGSTVPLTVVLENLGSSVAKGDQVVVNFGQAKGSTFIPDIAPGSTAEVPFEFTAPSGPGDYTLGVEVFVPLPPGDLNMANNKVSLPFKVV